MPSPQEREAALFALAFEMPVAERASFLQAGCGADGALRQRLEILLAAHDLPDESLGEDSGPPALKATMKLEIAEEPALRKTGTIVEVDHPVRGKYLRVGNPIKLSDSPTEVKRSPLLCEHTDEVMAELGYRPDQIAHLRAIGVI